LPTLTVKQKPVILKTEQLELFAIAPKPGEGGTAYTPLGGGLYRHNPSGMLYERPIVRGRRTWRKLDTAREKTARDEMARRRHISLAAQTGAIASPYTRPVSVTVSQCLADYIKAGTPDRQRRPRNPQTAIEEQRRCQTLDRILGSINVENLAMSVLDRYIDQRQQEVQSRRSSPGGEDGRGNAAPGEGEKGSGAATFTGRRASDMEINTLNNALLWAVRSEKIKRNPLPDIRVRACTEADVSHCREFKPHDVEELHQIVTWLFQRRGNRSESAGWQYLLEAMTGLRTKEALSLRLDAMPGQPGHIEICQQSGRMKALHVRRAKAGINPFVIIYPELETALIQHRAWHQPRYPDSPWYFPGFLDEGKTPLSKASLAHILRRASRAFGRKLTSHGTRAYYVTVRRSWGISDPQIAIEIGQASGGALLAKVYGGVPSNWLTGDGPKMPWLPTANPCWSALPVGRDSVEPSKIITLKGKAA
jgi:integrase